MYINIFFNFDLRVLKDECMLFIVVSIYFCFIRKDNNKDRGNLIISMISMFWFVFDVVCF